MQKPKGCTPAHQKIEKTKTIKYWPTEIHQLFTKATPWKFSRKQKLISASKNGFALLIKLSIQKIDVLSDERYRIQIQQGQSEEIEN